MYLLRTHIEDGISLRNVADRTCRAVSRAQRKRVRARARVYPARNSSGRFSSRLEVTARKRDISKSRFIRPTFAFVRGNYSPPPPPPPNIGRVMHGPSRVQQTVRRSRRQTISVVRLSFPFFLILPRYRYFCSRRVETFLLLHMQMRRAAIRWELSKTIGRYVVATISAICSHRRSALSIISANVRFTM